MDTLSFSHRNIVKLVVLLAIGLCGHCRALPTSNADDTDRLVAIANKVDAIDNKLSSLSRGHDRNSLMTKIEQRLDNIDNKVDALAAAANDGLVAIDSTQTSDGVQQETTPKTEEEKQGGQEEFSYVNCVNLLSVARTPTEEGNRFTLNYTKNAEEIVIHFQNDVGMINAPDSITERGGFYSAIYTSKHKRPYLLVGIGDKVEESGWSFMDSRHLLQMRLNDTEGEAMVQHMEPLPELHLDPPTAAIYEPGQDFNITESVTFSGDLPENFHMFESFQGINLTDGQIYLDFSRDTIFSKRDDDYNPNKTRETVTVLTSANTISGYFLFGVNLQIPGPLVFMTQVNRLIPFRPSNQTSLPPNYLGIFEQTYIPKSKNGNELNKCRPGHECQLGCFGVGEAISDMQVVKQLPDGTTEAVPSATMLDNPSKQKSFQAMSWTFQVQNDTDDDSDGITTFQCTAYDETNGKQVSKLIDVQAVLDDGIDEARSNVTVEEEYMEPHIKIVTLNCAIYGRPIPDVSFSSGTSYIFNMDTYEPDSVISTGRNTAVATKTLRLDMNYLEEYRYTIYETDTMPSCGLWSNSQHQYLEYTFQIPDLGLEEEM